MPSISLRRNKYWIQFYLPGSSRPIRQSLGVEDRAEAERISDKLGNMLALLDPRLADVEIPATVLAALPQSPVPVTAATPASLKTPAAGTLENPPAPLPTVTPRVSITEAVKGYYAHVSEANEARWVSVKVKVLRVLFGDPLVADATGLSFEHLSAEAGIFQGAALEEISSSLLGEMVASRKGRDGINPATDKTKRHYREVLHDFFEFCLSHSLMEVRNFHTPNPVAALPSYLGKKGNIRFLQDTEASPQIDAQYAALAHNPSVLAAVTIMIEAGLRRTETLWLDRDSISPDFRVLSVATRHDSEADRDSSLKTEKSHRTVTISPKLRAFLQAHLPALEGRWLVPSPQGMQWDSDNFSSALRTINEAANLPWTCLDFRHTFATRRAFRDKWTSIRLAREMGTSVAMIDRYYAAFLRHDED